MVPNDISWGLETISCLYATLFGILHALFLKLYSKIKNFFGVHYYF